MLRLRNRTFPAKVELHHPALLGHRFTVRIPQVGNYLNIETTHLFGIRQALALLEEAEKVFPVFALQRQVFIVVGGEMVWKEFASI